MRELAAEVMALAVEDARNPRESHDRMTARLFLTGRASVLGPSSLDVWCRHLDLDADVVAERFQKEFYG